MRCPVTMRTGMKFQRMAHGGPILRCLMCFRGRIIPYHMIVMRCAMRCASTLVDSWLSAGLRPHDKISRMLGQNSWDASAREVSCIRRAQTA
jgi:hypothetical protein